PWPTSDVKRCTHTFWRWNTPEPGPFWSGFRIYPTTWLGCGKPCERRNDAGPWKKPRYANRLYQPHADVTAAILPNVPRFGECCTCVEYPTRNIAARLALTQRSSAWPAAIGGLYYLRAHEWPVQLPCRFSMENPAFPDTSPRSVSFRCWTPSRNTCSPNAGPTMT